MLFLLLSYFVLFFKIQIFYFFCIITNSSFYAIAAPSGFLTKFDTIARQGIHCAYALIMKQLKSNLNYCFYISCLIIYLKCVADSKLQLVFSILDFNCIVFEQMAKLYDQVFK